MGCGAPRTELAIGASDGHDSWGVYGSSMTVPRVPSVLCSCVRGSCAVIALCPLRTVPYRTDRRDEQGEPMMFPSLTVSSPYRTVPAPSRTWRVLLPLPYRTVPFPYRPLSFPTDECV